MRLLTRADFKPMPWKNGKGTTTELWREDDPLGQMLWRVSIAGVTEDGPFSPLPGYDRHILALTGEGMTLHGGPEGPVRVAPIFTPQQFSGDWPVTARLLGGPLSDFNLMIRRGWASGSLRVWGDAHPVPAASPAGTRLIWLQAGMARLGTTEIVEGQVCLLDPGEGFTLVTSPETRIIACLVQPAR